MALEINTADGPRGVTVLLHPHPHFGGNRFHPFIEGLFRRLPDIAVNAIRFDFTSAEPSAASQQVVAALDEGAAPWPELPPSWSATPSGPASRPVSATGGSPAGTCSRLLRRCCPLRPSVMTRGPRLSWSPNSTSSPLPPWSPHLLPNGRRLRSPRYRTPTTFWAQFGHSWRTPSNGSRSPDDGPLNSAGGQPPVVVSVCRRPCEKLFGWSACPHRRRSGRLC